MPSLYFQNFPRIKYDSKFSRNILLRAKFFKDAIANKSVFYPYTIKEGERSDIIANNYYGDSNYYWLVLLSNDLIDPYFDWPMTQEQFNSYIVKKYGSIPTASQTILHYKYNEFDKENDIESMYKENYKVSIETYQAMNTLDKSYWSPVYAYDYEFDLNESKREILLLSADYLSQVENEISRIFR